MVPFSLHLRVVVPSGGAAGTVMQRGADRTLARGRLDGETPESARASRGTVGSPVRYLLHCLYPGGEAGQEREIPLPVVVPPSPTPKGVFPQGRNPWLPELRLPLGSQHSSSLVTLILLLSGQCPNPGPPVHPCGVCGSNVVWGFWSCWCEACRK